MRSFSYLLILLSSLACAANEQDDLEAILKSTEQAVEEFRKSEDLKTLLAIKKGQAAATQMADEIDGNEADYMRMGNVRKVSEEILEVKLPESTSATPNLQKKKTLDPDAFIFVSLSMPKGTLRSLFEYAVARKDEMNIKFVTRGWKQKEFRLTMSRFAKLWPSSTDPSKFPQMITHPKLFETMKVDMVPAIAVKVNKGYWGLIKGVNSVELAEYYVEKGDDFGSVRGQVYPIEEPNLIDEIKRAADNYDWSKGVERATESARRAKPTTDLPTSRIDESYLVDLTIRAKKEIRHPDGRVIVEPGQLVNPLMEMSMSNDYVFFDARDRRQIEIVKEWISTKKRVQLIASSLPDDPLERMMIKKELGLPIGMLNSMIASRFKLRAVPSIVEQENLLIRVTIKGVN